MYFSKQTHGDYAPCYDPIPRLLWQRLRDNFCAILLQLSKSVHPFSETASRNRLARRRCQCVLFHANIAELMVLFLISFYFKLLFIHCSWMFMNTSVLRPMCESQRTVFKILLSPSTLNSRNQTHVSGLQDKHFYLLSLWTGLGVVFISSSWKASCVVMKTHHTQ